MVQSLTQLGLDATHNTSSTIFWSAVMGGWIIATVAWLVSGSHSITGSVMIIWMLTFVVGLGNFAHCIATSGEILAAVLTGQAPWTSYARWILFAVAFGLSLVRDRIYGQDLSDLEYVASMMTA